MTLFQNNTTSGSKAAEDLSYIAWTIKAKLQARIVDCLNETNSTQAQTPKEKQAESRRSNLAAIYQQLMQDLDLAVLCDSLGEFKQILINAAYLNGQIEKAKNKNHTKAITSFGQGIAPAEKAELSIEDVCNSERMLELLDKDKPTEYEQHLLYGFLLASRKNVNPHFAFTGNLGRVFKELLVELGNSTKNENTAAMLPELNY